jgi:hypothetical protein
MTEENNEVGNLWGTLKSVEPALPVELPDDGKDGDGHETLDDRMDSFRKLSDLQVADRRLNPDLGVAHLNTLQMSRIFPDTYNPLFRILVKGLLRRFPDMAVDEAIAKVTTATSIAIDGEGRIDEITIMGKSAEAETEKTMKKAGLI